MTHSPSSTTIPAYTVVPLRFTTGSLSPVSDAWFTMTSPPRTTPSTGITPPICTVTVSPSRTWETGSKCSSPSSPRTQARSTLRLIVRASESTLRLCVHSSSSSPTSSRNMTEPAVPKSPRAMDMPMLSASSISTFILPRRSQCSPWRINGAACQRQRAIFSGLGKSRELTALRMHMLTSFSS